MLKSHHKVAVYMQGHIDSDYGKMGAGVLRYLKNPIVGVIDKDLAGKPLRDYIPVTNEVPILASIKEALDLGAEVLILGIAPSGGKIPEEWNPVL